MLTHAGVVRRVAGGLTFAALLVAYDRVAYAQDKDMGGSDQAAGCITDAWDRYLGCIDDLPWWAELLCAARFSSDVVLCIPKEVLSDAKKIM